MSIDKDGQNSGPGSRPQPSRSSVLVAAARAFGSREPEEAVRNPDTLADRLIGPDELALLGEHPLGKMNELDYEEAGQIIGMVLVALYMLLRTRFIDEALERAVRTGATQVAILGAGFDSRAYRFRDLLEDCRVVEFDAAPTQEYKKRRLEAASLEVPPNLTHVCIDFAEEDLGQALRAAGLRAEEKTFYIWEGVSMYLPESSVRSTLQTIVRQSAPGSALVLDYANRLWLDTAKSHLPSPFALPSTWQEPWLFGVPDVDGREFFRELGLEIAALFASNDPELVKRYAMRADGTMYGQQVFQRMRAEMLARAAAAGPDAPPVATASSGAMWLAELIVP